MSARDHMIALALFMLVLSAASWCERSAPAAQEIVRCVRGAR